MVRTLVVFDLDGTLVDSLRDLAESASELVTELGGSPLGEDRVAGMVGDGAGLLVRRALVESGLDPATPGALERFLKIYDRRLLDHTVAYDGVPETLQLVSRRARFAVLTNKPLGASTRILAHLGLADFFDSVIGGDGPHLRKPHPAGLLATMGQSPGRATLFVGDSPVDEETARAAGCWFGYARYGFGAARFGADGPNTSFVLDRPRDLAGVLDRLEALTSGA